MPKKQSGKLRIIAGKWGGRVIEIPALDGLRPTGARMRETLFNWLQADIGGSRCLDLFAGSGALGLEALSRGAASCVALDQSALAVAHLRQCKQHLAAPMEVIRADALSWSEACEGEFDIVFCDPPFDAELWDKMVPVVTPLLAKNAKLYIEAPKRQTLALEGLAVIKQKTYGDVQALLLSVR